MKIKAAARARGTQRVQHPSFISKWPLESAVSQLKGQLPLAPLPHTFTIWGYLSFRDKLYGWGDSLAFLGCFFFLPPSTLASSLSLFFFPPQNKWDALITNVFSSSLPPFFRLLLFPSSFPLFLTFLWFSFSLHPLLQLLHPFSFLLNWKSKTMTMMMMMVLGGTFSFQPSTPQVSHTIELGSRGNKTSRPFALCVFVCVSLLTYNQRVN